MKLYVTWKREGYPDKTEEHEVADDDAAYTKLRSLKPPKGYKLGPHRIDGFPKKTNVGRNNHN